MKPSERVLRNWRIEALKKIDELEGWDANAENTNLLRIYCERILKMTQVLLDQYLLLK